MDGTAISSCTLYMYVVQHRTTSPLRCTMTVVNEATSAPRRPRRAPPKPRLSRDALVDAAMAIADAEGLDAVTIRRVAGELGVTPMALYWHVRDKDELLEALAERMFDEVELPPDSGGPWHVELAAALDALLTAIKRHPAVAPLAPETVFNSEASLEVAERTLRLMARGGFDDRALAELAAYLLCSIVTLVTAQPGPARAADTAAREAKLEAKQARLAALPGDRYPSVARLAGALADCEDEDSYYRRGLDLLVLGLCGLAGSPDKASAGQ